MKEISQSTNCELQDRFTKTFDAIGIISAKRPKRAKEVISILYSRTIDIASELKKRNDAKEKTYTSTEYAAQFIYIAPDGRKLEGYHARMLNHIRNGVTRGYTPIGVLTERIYGQNTPETRKAVHGLVSRTNDLLKTEGKTLEKLHTPKKEGERQSIVGYFLRNLSGEVEPTLPSIAPEPPVPTTAQPDGEIPFEREPADGNNNRTQPTPDSFREYTPAIFEDKEKVGLFRRQFREASVEEMDRMVGHLMSDAFIKSPELSSLEFYRQLVEILPSSTQQNIQKGLKAATCEDKEVAQIGVRVLTYLRLRTIISAFAPFVTDDKEKNEELFHEVLTNVYKKISDLGPDYKRNPDMDLESSITVQAIYSHVQYGAQGILSHWENIPREWSGTQNFIEVGEILEQKARAGRTSKDLSTTYNDLAFELRSMGLTDDMIRDYFIYILSFPKNTLEADPSADTEETVIKTLTREGLMEVMDSLPSRQRLVLELQYGLHDGNQYTQRQIAKELGVTATRVYQIQGDALRSLRHPKRAKLLDNKMGSLSTIEPDKFLSIQTKPEWGEPRVLTAEEAKRLVEISSLKEFQLIDICVAFGGRRMYELELTRDAFGALWKAGHFNVSDLLPLMRNGYKEFENRYLYGYGEAIYRYTAREILRFYSEIQLSLWKLYGHIQPGLNIKTKSSSFDTLLESDLGQIKRSLYNP